MAGLLAVIDSKATLGDVFNIGNDVEITIEDLSHKIIELTGSSSVIEKVLYEKAYASGFEDMQRRIPDISKIKRAVGWSPKLSLESIIVDIAFHLRA